MKRCAARTDEALSNIVDDYRVSGLGTEILMRMAEDTERHRKLLEEPFGRSTPSNGIPRPNSDIRRAMEAAVEANRTYERMFRDV